MRVINLDEAFQPFSGGIHPKIVNFPSGCEPHVKLTEIGVSEVLITARITSMDEFMRLLLATDALRRSGTKTIHVFLPYLPFARQDRVMVPGEPLSVKVIADLINAQNYASVTIFDPHSDVAPALINNVKCISNHTYVDHVLGIKPNNEYYLVSPDAGAYKKIYKVAEFVHYKSEIVMCGKLRDLNTGSLHSVTVSHDDLKGKHCVIIDDICDGGGTFNLLSDELKARNAGPIYLIVSHGIFSKGLQSISPNITKVYTTDSFQNMSEGSPFYHKNKEYGHRFALVPLRDILDINQVI